MIFNPDPLKQAQEIIFSRKDNHYIAIGFYLLQCNPNKLPETFKNDARP